MDKASTGYTFKNVDKETQKIIDILLTKGVVDFKNFKSSSKFTFYDDLFIDVLFQDNKIGSYVFSKMFMECDNRLIFKFLDEGTTLLEDLKVIWSCPKIPFIKSLF